jgi:tetratricopeptide (TPR) repeat protein
MKNITLDHIIDFLTKNQKKIGIVLGGVIAVVGLAYYVTQVFMPSRETEAQEAMYMAQINFEKGNFDLALKGQGKHKGFNYVKDNYSFTKAQKLAGFYAGLCYLNMGQFDKAIEDLKGYSSDVSEMQALSYCALGDCYAEKNNMKEAVNFYEKAANATKNPNLAPSLILKAGKAFEANKDNKKAAEMYVKIEKEFPNSQEGQTIEMYKARVGAE